MGETKPFGVLLTDPEDCLSWDLVRCATLPEAEAAAKGEREYDGALHWQRVEIVAFLDAPRLEGRCQCGRMLYMAPYWVTPVPSFPNGDPTPDPRKEPYCPWCGSFLGPDGWATPSPLYQPDAEEAFR